MYNRTQVISALSGLVGWRQNIDPQGWQLESNLTSSSSGYYYNGAHALLTIDNLISICPQVNLIDSSSAAITAAFSKWLREATQQAMLKALDKWILEKSGLLTAANLLERNRVFESTGNITDLDLKKNGRFIGWEISPSNSRHLKIKISSIGLQFSQNETFSLYLYESGKNTPTEIPVVYDQAPSVQWLPQTTITLDGKGAYYLGYFEDDLTAQSINGIREYNAVYRGLRHFPGSPKHFLATCFSVGHTDETQLWDLSKNVYTTDTNHGLNFDFNVNCDYTDFIIEQKDLFAPLIQLAVAIKLMENLASNPESRVNRNESTVSRDDIMYALEGDTRGDNSMSLYGQFKTALKSIQFDTTNIDPICLPCARRGVRFKTVKGTLSAGYYQQHW